MKISKLILVAVVCLNFVDYAHSSQTYINDNSFADLSSSELATKKHKASTGDSEAAYAVARYYLFIKSDKESAIKWMRIAAVGGKLIAKYNLAVLLSLSESKSDKAESKKWFEEAARDGIHRG